jgi:hypothetical protein
MLTGCLLIIFNLGGYQGHSALLGGDKIGLVLTCGYAIAFLKPGDLIYYGAGNGAKKRFKIVDNILPDSAAPRVSGKEWRKKEEFP